MQTNRKAGKKLLAILLTLAMVLGMFSMQVAAVDESNEKVRVIVENTTFTVATANGTEPAWTGTLIDTEVTLSPDSTAMSCVIDAIQSEGYNEADDITFYDPDKKYINGINGLTASAAGYSSGWTATLDDWFVNTSLADFTREYEQLMDGSIIRVMFTVDGGSDVDSKYNDSTKTLSGLAVSGAKLVSTGENEYNLVVYNEDGADVTVTPTATNKNFIAATYKKSIKTDAAAELAADSWYNDENHTNGLVLRGREFSVKPGDTVTVVVGAPNWPSMSNGYTDYITGEYIPGAEKIDPGVYTLNVVLGQKSGGGSGTTNYYVVHTYTDGNGTVEPEGNVMVRSGSDKTFTITPNAGYEVADVVVNGKSVGAVTSYTFKNVDHDGNIDVTFAKTTGSAAVKNPNTGAAL